MEWSFVSNFHISVVGRSRDLKSAPKWHVLNLVDLRLSTAFNMGGRDPRRPEVQGGLFLE